MHEVDYILHLGELLGLHSFEASIDGFSFLFGINHVDSESEVIEAMIQGYREAILYSTSDKDSK